MSFDRIWSWPKPSQRPYPPILVGGYGPGVVDRVLAYGDGWLAVHADDVIERANDMCARADRPISKMVMGVPPEPRLFEAYAEGGFPRISPWVESDHRSAIEKELDVYELAISDFYGSLSRD